MALRGKKPAAVQKRLKALFYGPAGVGKTMAAIQFPRPYLIDTEKGAENDQYVKALEKVQGATFFTNDFDELLAEVTELLTVKHEYRTLVIDPLTVIYNDLLDKSAKALATEDDPSGTAFGRHKQTPDRKTKHLLNLLIRLDMNVIITSHAKTKWERNGKDIVDAGLIFDCYPKLDYLFDLVFEINKKAGSRVGYVKKTRCEGFPEGSEFPFSYDEIAERYGRAVLERKAEAAQLASAEQVAELERLVGVLHLDAGIVDKWLEKSQSETFSEMPADTIAKCIGWCKAQVDNGSETKPAKKGAA